MRSNFLPGFDQGGVVASRAADNPRSLADCVEHAHTLPALASENRRRDEFLRIGKDRWEFSRSRGRATECHVARYCSGSRTSCRSCVGLCAQRQIVVIGASASGNRADPPLTAAMARARTARTHGADASGATARTDARSVDPAQRLLRAQCRSRTPLYLELNLAVRSLALLAARASLACRLPCLTGTHCHVLLSTDSVRATRASSSLLALRTTR
jgi:hypothetical protein